MSSGMVADSDEASSEWYGAELGDMMVWEIRYLRLCMVRCERIREGVVAFGEEG